MLKKFCNLNISMMLKSRCVYLCRSRQRLVHVHANLFIHSNIDDIGLRQCEKMIIIVIRFGIKLCVWELPYRKPFAKMLKLGQFENTKFHLKKQLKFNSNSSNLISFSITKDKMCLVFFIKCVVLSVWETNYQLFISFRQRSGFNAFITCTCRSLFIVW